MEKLPEITPEQEEKLIDAIAPLLGNKPREEVRSLFRQAIQIMPNKKSINQINTSLEDTFPEFKGIFDQLKNMGK